MDAPYIYIYIYIYDISRLRVKLWKKLCSLLSLLAQVALCRVLWKKDPQWQVSKFCDGDILRT